MVIDRPGSDGVVRVGKRLNVEHRQHKGLSNRAKNAHLPTQRRKRIIKRFTSARHLKRLVLIHDPVANLPDDRIARALDREGAASGSFKQWKS